MSHPTQVFLHNPKGLRVEYRLDDERLIVWWSPLAGVSWKAADRNFSNRDNPLEVFTEISLPGCGLPRFEHCDYDPWHIVLRFKRQALHLAVRPDEPCVVVWGEAPLAVELKSTRDDRVLSADGSSLVLGHDEAGRRFEFAALTAPAGGGLRHSPFRTPGSSHYTRADLAPGQPLLIAAGVDGENISARLAPLAAASASAHLEAMEGYLAPLEEDGRTVSSDDPRMDDFRRILVRGLASMIDASGAFRASLKAIYYLIWVRDAGFAFAFQSAAGWPHRLPELCRLLLQNPTTARGDGIPRGRMFAQLINPDYGKYEEDGIYYVLWTLFTHWTQTGDRSFFEGSNRALLDEALSWVEQRAFDSSRGLFGGYFADETPAFGSRDYGWDYAVGKPAGDECIRHGGKRIVRSYDTYLNTVMHSAYSMMAAVYGEESYQAKADELWGRLAELYDDRIDGLPPYGDLLSEDGDLARARKWGPATSVYIWGLVMPNFLPLDDRDAMTGALLSAVLEKPTMHWINGICATIAAADPWIHGEDRLLAVLNMVRDEATAPGQYLPMGGAMPEKLHATPGSLHNDIRPQGFAMAAWLGAWSSLGVRRLPFGLAVRPTKALRRLENFRWRGRILDFEFPRVGGVGGIQVDGTIIEGTLQIPEDALGAGRNTVRPAAGRGPLLLRSNVALHRVTGDRADRSYHAESLGSAELAFAQPVGDVTVHGADGSLLPLTVRDERALRLVRFRAHGRVVVKVRASPEHS